VTRTGVRVDWLLGEQWVNVTRGVRVSDIIAITRGRTGEGQAPEPATATMKIDNGATAVFGRGWASPRNPTSPFYGLLGRNTKQRISVPYGGSYLRLPGQDGDTLQAPDSAGVSVTGDIDVRIDLELDDWYAHQGLVSKYVRDGDQRSWSLELDEGGYVTFYWTTAGTLASRVTARSTAPITVAPHGRLAIRATLDADNGAGGNTVTFYTGDSIAADDWTQLGDPVINAGATSIFDGTAPLEVGYGGAAASARYARGRCFAFELRSGIGGTVVADPDFEAALFGRPYLVGSVAQAAGSTTVAVPVTAAVAEGDQVAVVAGTSGGATISSVVDSRGNTYAPVTSETAATPRTYHYQATAAAALEVGDTITVTLSSSAQAYNVIAAAASGVLAVDVSNHATGSSTTPSVTSPALAGPYELAVASISNGNGGGSPAWAAGWNVLATMHNGSTHWTSAAWRTTSTAAAVTASATIVSANWTALVAVFTAAADNLGVGPWVDPQGIVWTPQSTGVVAPVEVTDRDYRFHGELADLPPRWDLSGNDAYVPVTAAAMPRRLSQGATPLRSAMYRLRTSQITKSRVMAHWSCEDAAGASTIASGIPGYPPMQIIGSPELASNEEWTAAGPLPVMKDGRFTGIVPAYTPTGEISVPVGLVNVTSPVAAETSLLHVVTTGTARTWEIRVDAAGNLRTRAFDEDGGSLLNDVAAFAMNSRGFVAVILELTQDGADVDWRTVVVDTPENGTISDVVFELADDGTIAGETIGRATTVTIGRDRGLTDVVIGDVLVADAIDAFAGSGGAAVAFRGERPAVRAARLAAEEGIAFAVTAGGDGSNFVGMGAQKTEALLELLADCEATDGGRRYDPRDQVGLGYRTRTSLYNQQPALELSCSWLGSPTPTDDDRFVRNDISISREDGSTFRVEQASGPLNVNDPDDDPDGVGRYDTSETVSLTGDELLPQLAGWQLLLGTVDEPRYPTTEIMLHGEPFASDPALRRQVLALIEGDRYTLDDLPAGMPPDLVSQIADGFVEEIGTHEHFIRINGVPESPYQVAVRDTDRRDTAGSELAAAVDEDDTALTVVTTLGPIWTQDPAHFPFDLLLGGERVTVTAIAAAARDTFTRTLASSWGAATSGQIWATSGGAPSDHSVTGTVGRQAQNTVNVFRGAVLPEAYEIVDLYFTVSTSATATGAGHTIRAVARYTDANNYYTAQLFFSTTQTVELALRRLVAGTATTLDSLTVPGLTHGAGTQFRGRLHIIGDQLRAKVWLAAAAEPTNWQVAATDTTFTAGQIGIRSRLESGNTNLLPVNVDVDNFELVNPQTFTVTRSVNGVVKPHAIGAAVPSRLKAVRLAKPAIRAL
jgi:hypothetical protein